MSFTLSLPRISTNVRFPEFAAAIAERLFLTPPRPRDAIATAIDLIDARSSMLEHKGRHIAMWRWGSRDAPAVLLAHGWGGHAAQMRAFVFPLLQAGYRVVAYDQPAHGVSEGRLTGLPDFADVLAEVAWYHGDVKAVIGHSLGGAGAAVALGWAKLQLEKIVLISPPADLVGYSRRFARWYWIPEAVRKGMQRAIEERYGVRWEQLEVPRVAPRLTARALVIHDRDDRMMPWLHGATVARHWPGARLMSTDGLGHQRILADESVTRAAADFIAGRSAVASPARPAVPYPSALY
ncbi:MAG TPA: alpha/beta fold hydrolase [Burkholderiales bacterium]|nr:alpha/beta fold hydrolase [Burkholderiales bacterium]